MSPSSSSIVRSPSSSLNPNGNNNNNNNSNGSNISPSSSSQHNNYSNNHQQEYFSHVNHNYSSSTITSPTSHGIIHGGITGVGGGDTRPQGSTAACALSSSTTTTSSTSTASPACAACKYQRRKCQPDCTLAPYFPAELHNTFIHAHKLFGVSNILKTLRGLDPSLRPEAMRSIIFHSNARAQDPVLGCCRHILELQHQIALCSAELNAVLGQLAAYRTQQQQLQDQQLNPGDSQNQHIPYDGHDLQLMNTSDQHDLSEMHQLSPQRNHLLLNGHGGNDQDCMNMGQAQAHVAANNININMNTKYEDDDEDNQGVIYYSQQDQQSLDDHGLVLSIGSADPAIHHGQPQQQQQQHDFYYTIDAGDGDTLGAENAENELDVKPNIDHVAMNMNTSGPSLAINDDNTGNDDVRFPMSTTMTNDPEGSTGASNSPRSRRQHHKCEPLDDDDTKPTLADLLAAREQYFLTPNSKGDDDNSKHEATSIFLCST